jgi:hypothetical protein
MRTHSQKELFLFFRAKENARAIKEMQKAGDPVNVFKRIALWLLEKMIFRLFGRKLVE